MSGASNIAAKAGKKFDIENDKAILRRVLEKVQDLENAGYQFEAAEASFELLLRKEIGRYHEFFDLEHYRVVVLKMRGDERRLRGDGEASRGRKRPSTRSPKATARSNALDMRLRASAHGRITPRSSDVHLTDYKVRVINSKDETAANVRVIIECRRDQARRQPRKSSARSASAATSSTQAGRHWSMRMSIT